MPLRHHRFRHDDGGERGDGRIVQAALGPMRQVPRFGGNIKERTGENGDSRQTHNDGKSPDFGVAHQISSDSTMVAFSSVKQTTTATTMATTISVSYTHLRAHETGRNLV